MAQFEIDKRQLGYAIMQEVSDRCGNPDDAGCDWYTDDDGNTYIAGEKDWRVSTIHDTATLVDAANILHYGSALKMAKEQVTA